ncbi:hypothetical protein P7K49_001652 [Saguinus oedipus]|uniref:Uncharacterized protein n=1 Tax=Saguinus oedipus TaxID=9490 RepID=A0ABQ9WF76_SAGOE|nr:hypothetical protein P7K49_001652 [Saguinus oedipus]
MSQNSHFSRVGTRVRTHFWVRGCTDECAGGHLQVPELQCGVLGGSRNSYADPSPEAGGSIASIRGKRNRHSSRNHFGNNAPAACERGCLWVSQPSHATRKTRAGIREMNQPRMTDRSLESAVGLSLMTTSQTGSAKLMSTNHLFHKFDSGHINLHLTSQSSSE